MFEMLLKKWWYVHPILSDFLPSTNPSEQLPKSRGEKHHKAKGNNHRLAWLLFRSYRAHHHLMQLPNQCVLGAK